MSGSAIQILPINNRRFMEIADLDLTEAELAFAGGSINEIFERIKGSSCPTEHLLFAIGHDLETIGFLALREGSARPHWAAHDTMTLHHFRIGRAWTGRGFGREAVVASARWISHHRPETACLALSVNESNERARRLYLRCGFKEADTRLAGRLGPQIIMRARLDQLLGSPDAV